MVKEINAEVLAPTEIIPRVLFICKWNIARSQIGEAILNHRTGIPIAESAGVYDGHQRFGSIPTPIVLGAVEEKFGFNLTLHQVKLLTEELLSDIRLIIIFCESEICPDYLTHFGLRIFIHRVETIEEELTDYFKLIPLESLEKMILHVSVPDPDGAKNEHQELIKTSEMIETIIESLCACGVIQHFSRDEYVSQN